MIQKEEIKLNNQANPVFASTSWNPKESQERQTNTWFETYSGLPLIIRRGLINYNTEKTIESFCANYKFSPEKTGEVSRIIREYFAENKGQEEFIKDAVRRAKEKLVIPREHIKDFIKELLGIIEKIKEIGRKETEEEYEKIPLLEAIKKYESVAQQLVSNEPIKLEDEERGIAPTISHWLEDYLEKMGTDYYNAVGRGKYLFESENAKKLNKKERDNLSSIIEAFNEKKNVFISKDKKEGPQINFELTNEFNKSFSKNQYKKRKSLEEENPIKLNKQAADQPETKKDSSLSPQLNSDKIFIENKMRVGSESKADGKSKEKNNSQVNLKNNRPSQPEKNASSNRNVLDLSEFINHN